MTRATLNISHTQTGDVTVVTIRGDLDGQTAGEAQQHMAPLLVPGSKIVLDLSGVEFLSSAGLRILLSAYRQLAQIGGRLVLSGPSEDLKDTLTITGLLRFLSCYDTLPEGVAALA